MKYYIYLYNHETNKKLGFSLNTANSELPDYFGKSSNYSHIEVDMTWFRPELPLLDPLGCYIAVRSRSQTENRTNIFYNKCIMLKDCLLADPGYFGIGVRISY